VRYKELLHEFESSISECVRLYDARGLMIRDNKPHPKAFMTVIERWLTVVT